MGENLLSNRPPIGLAQLTPEDLAKITIYRDKRDEAAMRLGVAEIELEKLKREIMVAVAQLFREEDQVAAELAHKYGIDKSKRWAVDHNTGIIHEIC